MSSLRSLKRNLKKRNVAIAEIVAKKRKERGYDHFANRRSINQKLPPMPEPSILPLVKEEPVKETPKEESKLNLPVFEAFDKYPEGSNLKGW